MLGQEHADEDAVRAVDVHLVGVAAAQIALAEELQRAAQTRRAAGVAQESNITVALLGDEEGAPVPSGAGEVHNFLHVRATGVVSQEHAGARTSAHAAAGVG